MAITSNTHRAKQVHLQVVTGHLRLPQVEGIDHRASVRAYVKLLTVRLQDRRYRLTTRIAEDSDYARPSFTVLVEEGSGEDVLAAIQREEDRLWSSPQEWQVSS
jgi:hypothetical protein